MLGDPGRILGQGANPRAVEAAGQAEVDVLDRGAIAEFGLEEAARQGAVLPPRPLLIDQHRPKRSSKLRLARPSRWLGSAWVRKASAMPCKCRVASLSRVG